MVIWMEEWPAKVCAAFRPGTGEIGMGQRLAFAGKQQHDVARRGLRLAKGKRQSLIQN
jgi:hypothetical protein